MTLRQRIINALSSHAGSFTTIRGSYLYISDTKPQGKGNATIDCHPSGAAHVELYNPASVTVDFDAFPENALPLASKGHYSPQCECVLFPEGGDSEEWVLFIETKYVRNQENARRREYDYPNQMVSQIKHTVDYFRRADILSSDKKVLAIISFPTLFEGYDSWSFPLRHDDGTTETVEDILINHKILIRATNYATIKSRKRIKLAARG